MEIYSNNAKKRNLSKTDFLFLLIAFGDTLIAALAGER